MKIISAFFSIFWILNVIAVYSQSQRIITGKVTDQKTNQGLAFASISLKNAAIGIVTNDNGEFDLRIPEESKGDTIFFSYLGYKAQAISLSRINGAILVKLEPQTISLSEVVVRPLPPTYYIKLAMQCVKYNYPNLPFEAEAYYRNRIWENNAFIKDAEAIVKSYQANYQGKDKYQHQIMLHRKGRTQKLKFMADKIEKEQLKEKRKALKKGEDFEDTDIETMLDMGGPETVLGLNFIKEKEHFLDSTVFKKYTYSFGKPTIYQGRDVMVINFENKKVVGHQRQVGKIFMDPDSYAIVSIDYKSDIVIPLLARPIIFAMGYTIEEPMLQKKYNYQLIEGKWYPQNLQLNANVALTKKHFFESNEVSSFQIENIYAVSKLNIMKAMPINSAKRFNPDKKLEEQVFSEQGISWENVNTIKK